MLTIVLARALDDVELPTVRKIVADCGCDCWITPATVATRLAMDTQTTCSPCADGMEIPHQEFPTYPREFLAASVGAAMADRLVVLAAKRMKEGLPI